jgi:signal transduction histidine kinase
MNNACYAVNKKAETESSDYQPEVIVNVSANGDSLIISIADNVEGMTDEVKQHLFENFFTTKPIGQGTGLGMAITRDIIENKHKGKLSFESIEGVGTTFTFSIPIKN